MVDTLLGRATAEDLGFRAMVSGATQAGGSHGREAIALVAAMGATAIAGCLFLAKRSTSRAEEDGAPKPKQAWRAVQVVERRYPYVIKMSPGARLKSRYTIEGPGAPEGGMFEFEATRWVAEHGAPYTEDERERVEERDRLIGKIGGRVSLGTLGGREVFKHQDGSYSLQWTAEGQRRPIKLYHPSLLELMDAYTKREIEVRTATRAQQKDLDERDRRLKEQSEYYAAPSPRGQDNWRETPALRLMQLQERPRRK